MVQQSCFTLGRNGQILFRYRCGCFRRLGFGFVGVDSWWLFIDYVFYYWVVGVFSKGGLEGVCLYLLYQNYFFIVGEEMEVQKY